VHLLPQALDPLLEQRRAERRRAEAGEGAAREAAAAADRQRVEEAARGLTQPVIAGAGRAWRVQQLLRDGTPDSIRAALRAAITARTAAETAHRAAEAEVASARKTIIEINERIASMTEDDAELDERAVRNWRGGNLGHGPDADMFLNREVETLRLADAQRAERVLAAALGEAHALLLNARETVEVTAAALVTVQIDAFAAALEEAEARTASLRTLLLSGGHATLVAPGLTPIPPQVTARMRRLAMDGPANARAVPDPKLTAAFQRHFGALLVDPEASLAAMDSAGQPTG